MRSEQKEKTLRSGASFDILRLNVTKGLTPLWKQQLTVAQSSL